MSGTLVKIITGVVLVVASLWWIVQGSGLLMPVKSSSIVTDRPALADLITLVNGGLPLFLVLIGLLIVWLEMDTVKTQRELSKKNK